VTEPRLTIELVPKTSFCKNVRNLISAAEWGRLRHAAYACAGNACLICRETGPKGVLHAHEVWEYTMPAGADPPETPGRQRLVGIAALCPRCHAVKHIGFANVMGRLEASLVHLQKVNGWSRTETEAYVEACFETWKARSKRQWQVDVSLLGRL
jgi:hypothetical protein